MKRAFNNLAGALSIALLFGCTAPSPSQRAVEEYQNLEGFDRSTFQISGLRYTALRDAALSVGARGGLAWRAKQINHIVSRYHHPLDRIFNFHALLLEKNILPPVLIEGQYSYDQPSDTIIRLADRSYAIESQARFVSLPPTWRDYIYLKFSKPEKPDPSMTPRNSAESKVWDRYIQEGWQAGIDQADSIFSENLGRLKRDYEGMLRYRNLLAQNIVSPPFVAEVNLGITGKENEMAVNDRTYRITALPAFRHKDNGEDWVTQSSPVYIR